MKKRVSALLTGIVMLLTMVSPAGVYAEEDLSDAKAFENACETLMDNLLSDDNALEFFGAPVDSDEEFRVLNEYLYMSKLSDASVNPYSIEVDIQPSADYSSCIIKLAYWYATADDYLSHEKEYKDIPIEYIYDSHVKAQADSFLEGFPKGEPVFEVRDMELINYWMHVSAFGEEGNANVLANYSGELKEYMDYSNFDCVIDARAGDSFDFYSACFGMGRLMFQESAYQAWEKIGAEAYHVLYVPDDTKVTVGSLKNAIQKRVDDYAGKGKVKIKAVEGGISKYKDDMNAWYDERIKEEQASIMPDADLIASFEDERKNFMDSFDEGGRYAFMTKAMEQCGDLSFTATVNGNTYDFVVLKDSSKMLAPKFKTKDAVTGVEINSESSEIPLDTAIDAKKIESGMEHDKLMSILGVSNEMTFDLNLHSKTLAKYVEKIDENKFEVRIPIKGTALEGKKLEAYYVDKDEKVHTYSVRVEDGYAIFSTDHFSVYTLAETGQEDKGHEEPQKEQEKGHKMGIMW